MSKITKRIEALRSSEMIQYRPDVAIFNEMGKWRLEIGNNSACVALGENAGEYRYEGNTMEECLEAAEKELLQPLPFSLLELKESCEMVERYARRVGKDCQIIFVDDGVSVAPLSWPGDSVGSTLFEALKDAMEVQP